MKVSQVPPRVLVSTLQERNNAVVRLTALLIITQLVALPRKLQQLLAVTMLVLGRLKTAEHCPEDQKPKDFATPCGGSYSEGGGGMQHTLQTKPRTTGGTPVMCVPDRTLMTPAVFGSTQGQVGY